MQSQQASSAPQQKCRTVPVQQRASTVVACVSQRPQWLDRQTKQLVAIIRDNSGSMVREKADEAARASHDLVGELATPINGGCFHCGVIDFATDAVITHHPTAASELVGCLEPIRASGATNISHALQLAHTMADCHCAGGQERWHPPVMVLFSDGEVTTGGDPVPHAARIKRSGAVLVTVAYGKSADLKLLRTIASSPRHCYRRSTSAGELRRFMASVGRTLVMTRATGQNPSQTLTSL